MLLITQYSFVPLSAWLFSTERWRNQERLEHLVSLVAVLEEEQVPVFICFGHYQVFLSCRVGISGFSLDDGVELLQPYSWLTWANVLSYFTSRNSP